MSPNRVLFTIQPLQMTYKQYYTIITDSYSKLKWWHHLKLNSKINPNTVKYEPPLILDDVHQFTLNSLTQILSTVHTKSNTATITATTAAPLLPYILLLGPAGCGKSTFALNLARFSGLPTALISGGDLEAMGTGAGLYLRGIFERYHKHTTSDAYNSDSRGSTGRGSRRERGNNKRYILIIDDVGPMIRGRKGHNSDPSTSNSSSVSNGSSVRNETCLYALLEGLRCNSSSLCVVLVAGLCDASEVDPALVSR